MIVHEVIDYSLGISAKTPSAPPSLCHIFFDTKEGALEYMSTYPRRELAYHCRSWGLTALMNLWIDDRRNCKPMEIDMKKLVKVEEIEGEGFTALLGQRITVFCMNYIYTGDLVGVNSTFILLENPAIVYETGSFTAKEWKDAQPLPNNLYIQTSSVESFGVVK